MKHVESIKLRDLHTFNCDDLMVKVNASKKDINLEYAKLIGFLNFLYVEILLSHSDDLALTLQVTVNNGTEKEISIDVSSNVVLMPHLCPYKKSFQHKCEIRTLNRKPLEAFIEKAIRDYMPRKTYTSIPQNKMFEAAKLVDKFFGEQSNVYNAIIENKIHEHSQKIINNDMILKFSLSQFSVYTRTAIRLNGTSYKFFEISFKDYGEESLSFDFFGSTIKVSNKKLDVDKLRQIFFNIANLNGIEVSTMSEFWNYVLVRKMEMI